MNMITALSMAVKLLQDKEERNLSDDDIQNAMATRHAYLMINDLIDNLKAVKKTEED